jgi:hypothetical protein
LAQQAQIPLLNVTPIFTEMHRNTIGTAQFSQNRSGNRIGLRSAAGLAEGCNVVNIDT